MSTLSSTQEPNKNPCRAFVIIAIIIVLVSVLIGMASTPSHPFDDIVYTLIALALVSTICLSCPALKNSAFRSWKTCGRCGGQLPPDFKVGQYCPHCHVLIAWEKSVFRGFRGKKAKDFDPHSGTQYEEIPGGGYKFTPEPTRRRNKRQKSEQFFPDEKEIFPMAESSSNPESSPFHPPFDDLFIDQKRIRKMFDHFINWAAVGYSLENWVESIKNDPSRTAIQDDTRMELRSGAERDATAKLAAWKRFERNGFTEPELLPGFYKVELRKLEKTEAMMRGGVKKTVHCPYCGSLDYEIEEELGEKTGEDKFKCKECGEYYTQKR